MNRPKRILAVVAALIGAVLLLLLVLPLLFRDRIEQRLKLEANRSLDARVDWRDAGLTFFRNFPNLTLRLDDLTLAGKGRFQGDTLAAIRHLGVVLDAGSVVRNAIGGGGPVVVRAVELDQPRLSLIALEDGTANWDITRDSRPETRDSKSMEVSLRRFQIKDGTIRLDNRKTRLKASMAGFDQSLTGDLSRERVTLQTRASADTVSVSFAGIPYLNRVRLGLTTDVAADFAHKVFGLRSTELNLNDLKLRVAGTAQSTAEALKLNLGFSAPSTEFRSILSLVPAVYARDFDKVKTSGTFKVVGEVKGEYGDSAFPSFALGATVDNGAFQYPDLPLPARDIVFNLSLTNPGGSPDRTVLNLDQFHMRLGRNPVDAKLVLRTPVSDPDVDLRVKGKLDLADVRRTVKLEGIDQLAGTVAADAAVRARMSAVDGKQYDKVAASGTVDVAGLTLKGKTFPHPLAIQQASLRLTPARAELRSFAGSVGSSDLQATGALENLLGYVFRDDLLRGDATVHSDRFNLNEWRSGEGDLEIIPVPAKLDFGLNATVNELTYDKLKMANARGKLRIKDQRVTLEDFRMNTLGGQMAVTGFYETTNLAKPTFDVGLKMMKVNIPSAFQAFTTVQMLAPVAKYASGNVTTDMHLSGPLGKNMMPLFAALTGRGTLQTSNVALHDFPAMEKIVDVTKLQILNNPTMQALKAAFQIKEGRLVMQPFDVKVAGMTMNVAGSNGIDQSLEYTLGLKVPRSLLGGGADQAIAGLVSKAGQAGVDLNAAPEIPLGIRLAGTVTNPSIKADVGSLATSVTKSAGQAVETAAKKKVSAEATRLVQAAERQAAEIRQQAQALADKVKQEGYQQADALTSKAGDNPLLQAAAKPAADQLRQETDNKASGIISEASRRADSVVAAAQRQADQISE